MGTLPPPHSPACPQVLPEPWQAPGLAGLGAYLHWGACVQCDYRINTVIAANYHSKAINKSQGRHEGPAIRGHHAPPLGGGCILHPH